MCARHHGIETRRSSPSARVQEAGDKRHINWAMSGSYRFTTSPHWPCDIAAIQPHLAFSSHLHFAFRYFVFIRRIQSNPLIWSVSHEIWKNKNGALLPSLIYNRGAILGMYCLSVCLSVCMATGLLGTNHYYCWLCLQYYSMFASIDRVIPYTKYVLKCIFLFI